MRILNLLEQHHKKLGEILKSAHERPAHDDVDRTPDPSSPEASKTQDTSAHPPRLPRASRQSTRQLSSSIATDLATARGIPGGRQKRSAPISPLISNQHADGQISQDGSKSKKPASQAPAQASRPSWAPPLQKPDEEQAATVDASDSPFSLFYNTFDNLVSKMSAPLAFAGLPLVQPAPEQAAPEVKPATKPSKTSKEKPMDYSHLISNAAFRAVVSSPNDPDPAPVRPRVEDSFYHVPATGGTMSYAELLARADRDEARTLRGHHRQISNLSNISEDDFVDAPSEIPPDHKTPKAATRRGMTDERKVDGKTMEELALENQALKHISDTLSRRLHVFEMSSQTSTAALAQSIRSMPHSPSMTPTTLRHKPSNKPDIHDTASTDGEHDERTQKRMGELEDILRKSDARAKKKDAENEKLRARLDSYKNRWDTLKESAKSKREQQNRARRESETIVEDSGEG